jgi:hypothetical protein
VYRIFLVVFVGIVSFSLQIGAWALPAEGTVLFRESSGMNTFNTAGGHRTSGQKPSQGFAPHDRRPRTTNPLVLAPNPATTRRVSLGVAKPHLAAAYEWYMSVDDAYSLYQSDTVLHKHYGRAALEELVLLAVGAALYWANEDTNAEDWDLGWDLDSWRKKFITGEGLAFDTNPFDTNAVSHPVAGTLYYLAARTNNLNILESFLYAFASSTIWEFIGELSEKVSINDMIATPVAGMAIGEVFAQLGAFFDRGANNVTNQVLSTLFSSPRKLNNWLDKRVPRRTGNVDRFGFTRDMFHQFRLWVAGGLATERSSSDADQASDSLGVVEFGLKTRLVNIPTYKQPGQVSRWLTDGNFSTFRFQATFSQSDLQDLLFFTKAALAGYYKQDIERDDDGYRKGYSIFLGVATAFDYSIERWPGREDDQIATVNILGPTLEFSSFHRGVLVDATLDIFGDFAHVRPYAVDKYLTNGGTLEGAKSVLAEQRYYYAWGITVSPHLRVTYHGFEIGGTFQYEYFNSFEGADRFPERVTNDFNLTDQRTIYKVWTAYTLPNDRLRFGFSFEHRYRKGEMLEVSDSSEENRYMGSMMLLF